MLPFMFIHLLKHWSMEHPALHMAADDLESFLWVLVWLLIHIFKKVTNITNQNLTIHHIGHTFSSSCIPEILIRESKIKRF